MTQFYRLAMPIIALALVPACDSDRAKVSDKAAATVVDKQKALDTQLDQQLEQAKRTDEIAADVSKATADFDTTKQIRLIGLRAERSIAAAQPPMLTTMADQLPLAADARTTVHDKIRVLEQDLVAADAKIDDLKAANAEQWKHADDAATYAMKKVEAARVEAWKALKTAKRTDHNAS
jgi:hypothetical protein